MLAEENYVRKKPVNIGISASCKVSRARLGCCLANRSRTTVSVVGGLNWLT